MDFAGKALMMQGRSSPNACYALFDDTFFKIFCEVDSANLMSGVVGCHLGHVVIDHDFNKLLKGCGHGVPAEFGLSLGGVAQQVDNVCGTVEVLRHSDEFLADKMSGAVNTNSHLVDALSFELKPDAHTLECEVGKLAHRVLHACGNDEVLGGLVLKDEPHALNIVLA